MKSDRVEIRDLLLRTIIGIKSDERTKKQDVLVNITLSADLRATGDSDEIDSAVNYRTVAKAVIALVEEASYYTVEKLAAEVARLIVTRFDVKETTVSIEKPGALRFARSVGVTITRGPEDFPA